MADETTIGESYYDWAMDENFFNCQVIKKYHPMVKNCYYDWILSCPMLNKFELFSKSKEIQSGRFGHYSSSEKFFLKLETFDGSARIYLKLSYEKSPFNLEKLKITMNDEVLIDTSVSALKWSNDYGYNIPNWEHFSALNLDIKFHCEVCSSI